MPAISTSSLVIPANAAAVTPAPTAAWRNERRDSSSVSMGGSGSPVAPDLVSSSAMPRSPRMHWPPRKTVTQPEISCGQFTCDHGAQVRPVYTNQSEVDVRHDHGNKDRCNKIVPE